MNKKDKDPRILLTLLAALTPFQHSRQKAICRQVSSLTLAAFVCELHTSQRLRDLESWKALVDRCLLFPQVAGCLLARLEADWDRPW